MKAELPDPDEEARARGIAEQCWLGPLCLAFWVFVVIIIFLISSCGGTFTLYPDGRIRYTTPEILKAPIVREK